VRVDESQKPGQFIITGSQNFELLNTVSQSLAGRTAIARLLPFSFDEISSFQSIGSIDQLLYTGFYPRIYDKQLNPTEALSLYFNTYIDTGLATFQLGIQRVEHVPAYPLRGGLFENMIVSDYS
jgi:uncharacterized protein